MPQASVQGLSPNTLFSAVILNEVPVRLWREESRYFWSARDPLGKLSAGSSLRSEPALNEVNVMTFGDNPVQKQKIQP